MTINLHFLDDKQKRVKVNLGVTKFQVSTDVNVSRGTGRSIAEYVVGRLKDFNLVPATLRGFDISEYCYVVTTDNASAEVNASIEHLKCRSQTCSAHTLALVLKGALAPNGTKSKVMLLLDRLAELAKAHKIGKGKAHLLNAQMQHAEPVQRPLHLLSRCATRWVDAYRLFERAFLLRTWLDAAFLLASKPAFSEEEWTILIQATAVLRMFKEVTIALQSTELCNGAHLVLIYKLALHLKNPSMFSFHPADFTPSPEQLNSMSERRSEARFDLWAKELTSGNPNDLHDDVRKLISDAWAQLQGRCLLLPHGKRQFNSVTAMMCLFFEPSTKWLIFNLDHDSLIFSKEQKMEAKTELLRLMRMFPRAEQEEDPQPPPQSRSFLDFGGDPLLAQPSSMRSDLLPATLGPARRVVDDALDELRRWEIDTQFVSQSMTEVWFGKACGSIYPMMAAVFIFLIAPEHCTATCERDFSVLAQQLTPLRKGQMSMQTVERKMFLLLNKGLWHPLPERAEEQMVKDLFARFCAEVPSSSVDDDEYITYDDDDEFV